MGVTAANRLLRGILFGDVAGDISLAAKADGRKLDFDGKTAVLSPEVNARYEQMIAELEEKKAGEVKEFTSVEDFMKGL